ncbi:MAG: SHOCT domain-containing protein [Haloarculaceae archaeon]
MGGPLQRLGENAVEVVSILVTGLWLAALFLNQDWWLAAMLVGYVVVIPLTQILVGETDDEDESEGWDETTESEGEQRQSGESGDSTDDALEQLRARYARGELTEAQFERKLERLLEVETVEDAERYAQRNGEAGDDERSRTREPERGRE